MKTRSVIAILIVAVASTAAITRTVCAPISAEAPYFAHMGNGQLFKGEAGIDLPESVFDGADPNLPMPLLVTAHDKSEELHAWVDVVQKKVQVRSKRGAGGGGDSRFSWLLLVPKACGGSNENAN
jgi:hypothetical protein